MSSVDVGPLTDAEAARLRVDLWGNGRPGVKAEVERIKRELYKNPDTGENGLIADVAQIKQMVSQIRALMWAAPFILGLIEAVRRLAQ